MDAYYKSDTVHTVSGVNVLVRKNECGWGGVVKAYTERPYAAFIEGKILRTAGGAVRTFSTRQRAIDAVTNLLLVNTFPVFDASI